MISLSHLWVYLYIFILATLPHLASTSDPIQGRYSFSLTTFSPDGKLPQLASAVKASTLGPPTIAISLSNGEGTIMVSLQELPSPLINDDATRRFVPITDNIWISHSGINADGRILTAAAQRLAIEHSYTFEEEIPLDILLEEIALLFQEYTMKPGSRPFGSTLLIVSSSSEQEDDDMVGSEPRIRHPYGSVSKMYTIEPSGSVAEIQRGMAFIGRGDYQLLFEKLNAASCAQAETLEEALSILLNILKEEIKSGNDQSEGNSEVPLTFVCATLARDGNNAVRRVTFE